MKRFRCTKCGVLRFSDEAPVMCMEPFPLRISGICGGAYIEEEYEDYN